MIYDTIRKLPMVTAIEIYETGDLSLLTDESIPMDKLIDIWTAIDEKYKALFNSQENNKVFNLSKEIDFQSNRFELIQYCCEALRFQKEQTIIDVLQEYNYTITDENYHKDIDRVLRESKGIINRINQLKTNLPKPQQANEDSSIIDLMASYSIFLEFDFDYYTISVEKFASLEKQVKAKIKAVTAQQQQSNNKKKK